jgi:DNA-binding NarL/FixJ family response regulator
MGLGAAGRTDQQGAGMTSIVLADDHRMFRQGLRELIERKTPFDVVGEAGTGREALELVERLQPDIVLLDLEMPELGGIAIAQRLAQTHPQVKIVVLTMYREDRQLVEAIQAGARAYLLKDADAAELISVLQRVERGEAALDATLLARVFDALQRGPGGAAVDALTERERDVLRLLAAGHDNRTIAASLNLSEKPIGKRVSEIFTKLGVSNRTQAALVAIQRGITEPPSDEQYRP